MFDHDYELISGDTFLGDWVAVIIGGTPVDLSTGWQVRAQVRDRTTDEKLFDLGV